MGYEYKDLIYERKGRITYITLNRPERLNALSMNLMKECGMAWLEFRQDKDAWVAIITGAGSRAMCSGLDVKDAAERDARGDPDPMQDWPPEIKRWGPRLYQVPKPIIAAVNGICAGGGLDFATECDITICSEDATFFDPHVSIGYVSGHEMVQLSRRIPLQECLRIALLGRQERMTAQRAYQLGLVSEVVPKERLLARATEIAEMILENGPLAVWGTKQGIWEGYGLPLDQAEILTEGHLLRVSVSEDHQEGPRAFAKKTKPQWKAK